MRTRGLVWRVALALLLPVAALSQNPALEERLPPETNFYVAWRGTAPLQGVRGSNPLLRLWDDPEFVPVRNAWLEELYRKATAEEGDLISKELFYEVLSHPLVFAEIPLPAAESTPGVKKTASIIVYRAGSLRERLEKVDEGERAKPPAGVSFASYEFRGRTVWKKTSPKSVSFETYVGDFFLHADHQGVLEDLIGRYEAESLPATGLGQSAEFAAARGVFESGAVLEFCGRIPETALAVPPSQPGASMMGALHPERMRVVAGSIRFLAGSTRFRVAVLGDTAPGSFFDLFGAGEEKFQTLALAPSGAMTYSVARLDLTAIYQVLRETFQRAPNPQQQGAIQMIEGAVLLQTGMPLPELLKVFTGELATFTPSFELEAGRQLFAAGIRDRAPILLALRTMLKQFVADEIHEGEVTYVSLAFPYADPKTGAQRERRYWLAVTPEMLLGAPRQDQVRDGVGRLGAPRRPVLLAEDSRFAAAQARLPLQLSGFTFFDLTRVPWESLQRPPASDAASANAPKRPEWTKQIPPGVLARHLRVFTSGWWKDASGLHCDLFLE